MPSASAGPTAHTHAAMADVQSMAWQLLEAVYQKRLEEQEVIAAVTAWPEAAWIAQCASLCPLPIGWEAPGSRSGAPGRVYTDAITGESQVEPPHLPQFAGLMRLVLSARQSPDEAPTVTAAIQALRDEALAHAQTLQDQWDGPHVDPATGAVFCRCHATGTSAWGDPTACSRYVAQVAGDLLGALPSDELSLASAGACGEEDAFSEVAAEIKAGKRQRRHQARACNRPSSAEPSRVARAAAPVRQLASARCASENHLKSVPTGAPDAEARGAVLATSDARAAVQFVPKLDIPAVSPVPATHSGSVANAQTQGATSNSADALAAAMLAYPVDIRLGAQAQPQEALDGSAAAALAGAAAALAAAAAALARPQSGRAYGGMESCGLQPDSAEGVAAARLAAAAAALTPATVPPSAAPAHVAVRRLGEPGFEESLTPRVPAEPPATDRDCPPVNCRGHLLASDDLLAASPEYQSARRPPTNAHAALSSTLEGISARQSTDSCIPPQVQQAPQLVDTLTPSSSPRPCASQDEPAAATPVAPPPPPATPPPPAAPPPSLPAGEPRDGQSFPSEGAATPAAPAVEGGADAAGASGDVGPAAQGERSAGGGPATRKDAAGKALPPPAPRGLPLSSVGPCAGGQEGPRGRRPAVGGA